MRKLAMAILSMLCFTLAGIRVGSAQNDLACRLIQYLWSPWDRAYCAKEICLPRWPGGPLQCNCYKVHCNARGRRSFTFVEGAGFATKV